MVKAVLADAGGVEFHVEDSGPGIAEEKTDKVFEPFFTTKAEGTGLGLANSRKIVQEHDGTIEIERGPRGGARFVLHLPAERVAESR